MAPTAQPIGPNGSYILRIQAPHDYPIDRAAAALASIRPRVPAHLDDKLILDTLTDHARTPVEQRPKADRSVITTYHRRLKEGGHFKRLSKVYKKGDPPAIRRVINVEWNFWQAVAALTKMRSVLSPKAGERTIFNLLREWTQDLTPLPSPTDPTGLDRENPWRKLLLKHDVFPVRAARTPNQPAHARRPADKPRPTAQGVHPMTFSSGA